MHPNGKCTGDQHETLHIISAVAFHGHSTHTFNLQGRGASVILSRINRPTNNKTTERA